MAPCVLIKLLLIPLQPIDVFLDYTVQLRHSRRIGTHPYNTHIGKIYPYEHLRTLNRQILKIGEVTQASHCRWECRLPLKHSAIKFENIRFHTESNPGPEVLPRLVTTRLDALSRL